MSDIDDLFETLTSLQRSKRLPPLHLWQPEHAGVIDIRLIERALGTMRALVFSASP